MKVELDLDPELMKRLFELLNCIERQRNAQAYTIEDLIVDLLSDVVDVWIDRCRKGELEEFWIK